MKFLFKISIVVFFLTISCGLSARNSNPKSEKALAFVANLVLPSATISGTTTVCQSAPSPVITFTGSGGTAPYTFTYTINGGSPLTVSTTGSNNAVTVAVNTTFAGTFVYNLTNVIDTVSPIQSVTGSATVTVKLSPEASLGGTGAGSNFNGIPVFRVCSNTISNFTFTNTSTTTAINSNYIINWGDSSPNFVSTSWTSTSHTYSIGLWNLVYTIQGNNGCTTTKNYTVFVGSNPAVSLGNPGNTDICNSSSLTFPITGTSNNPPGTTYTVTFNDGSTPQIFSHPPPSSVTHSFSVSSCGVTSSDGSNSYPNSFSANIVASNPCNTSSVGVVPIYVSTPPIADFTLPVTACTNTQVCLANTSVGAFENNGSSVACTTSAKIIWSISPAAGFSIASGSLGNDFNSTDPGLWLSGSNSLCLSFSQSGIYTITLKTGNRCGFDTKVKTICVEGALVPLFSLSNTLGCTPLGLSANNSTNVSNLCTVPTYLWTVTYNSGNCGISPANWSYVGGTSQSSPNPSFNFITPGTYSIKLTATNSCGAVTSAIQTVVVKKPPTASINAIPDFCGSAAVTPVAVVNSCAPASSILTYAWSFPGGIPASSSALNPGTISYTTAGNHTVSLTVTNECGVSTTATETFLVSVSPTITNATLSQTICSGTATSLVTLTSDTAGTSFSWTATATAGITGFTPSGTTNTIPIQTLTTTSATPGTVTYTITPSVGSCIGAIVNYAITVNPAPSFTNQPLSNTVCQGAVLVPLSVGIASSSGTPTYQWYSNVVSNTTTGTILVGETNATYTPATGTIGTTYYYCVITLSSSGCSNLTSAVATITVTPTASITAQPIISQDICVGVSIPSALTVSYSGGTGTPSYQWYSNTSNASTGGTAIAGATTSSYSPPVFNSPGTYYYYVVVSLTGTGCGPTTSSVASINVFSDPTVSLQPLVSQTLCQSATPATLNVVGTGGSGAFSYQWYSNTANNSTSGTLISGATTSTYSPNTTTIGTVYYYCLITQPSTLGCSVKSNTSELVVNAAPTITTQPQSSTVCQGGTPTLLTIAYTNGVGTPSYQWYSNTTNNTTTGTAISGEINSSYAPPAATLGIVYYYCVISLPSTGGCSSIASNTATVTITPIATIALQPIPNQSLCVGATIQNPLTITYNGGTGTASYQWYSNTSNSTVGGAAITGATTVTYTPPVFTSPGTFYYYVVLTLSGSGCGTTTSAVASIDVSADPTVSVQPLPSQTLCQGTTPAALSVTAIGGLGTFNYQWYATIPPGGLIPGATNSTFVPNTSGVGTTQYYCVITQQGLGCEVTSANAEVIVVPAPTFTTQPQSSAICVGGVPSSLSVAYTNGTGTASYQWYDGTGLIAGATNATFLPTVSTTTSYYCVVTFSTGGCTNITSDTALITVEPLPTIDLQPVVTQNICVGGIIAPLSVYYLNGSGIPTYQWYSSSTNTTSGGTPVGTNAPNYTPPAFNTLGTFYYYVEVTLSGNGCGTVTSNPAEVIVVADPVVTAQPFTSQTLCQGSTPTTLSVTATGGLGTYSYQWYSNTPPNTLISGATSDTFIPDTNITGTTNYYCVISQPGIGCEVVSNIAEVIVVPAPLITAQPQPSAVCEGGSLAPLHVAYSNGTGSATYQWFSNSTNTNSGGTIISGATTDTFNPPSTTVGTLFYYCEITFSSGGCTLISSNTAEVNIFQIPVIVDQNVVTCSGDVLNFIPQLGNGNTFPSNTMYTWTLISSNPLGSVTGTTNELVPQSGLIQTLVNNTSQVATVTYSVIPVAGICTGNPFTVTVLVYPKPAVIFNSANQTICNGATSNVVTLSSATPGAISFTWSANVPAGITGAALSGTALIPAQTLVNTTTSPLTVTYTAVGTFNYNGVGCTGPPSIYSITVNPTLVSSGTISNYNGYGVSFFGATDGTIDLTVTGGSGVYTYTWSGPNGFSATTEDLSGIPAGIYSVIIDDGFCAPTILTFTLTQPPELLFNEDIAVHVNLVCFGNSNGVLGITITQESVPPYDFQVINSSGTVVNSIVNDPALHQVFSGLVADTYSVKITDANGGVKTLSGIVITQPNDILITAATTPITCYGANNASITLTVSGGTGPYQAQWDNLATGFYQNNLSAATYNIIVTDANNCSKSIAVIIPEALLFTVNPIVKNISCFGANDGSINLNFVGGIPAITLSWSDGSTAGTTRNNLGPGTYSVTIIDGTPCTISRTFTIVEPQPLVLSANLINAFDCNDANSGSINLLVSGGTPPFTYAWSNGIATEDLSAIPAGNYFITVTDAGGCIKTASYVISRQAPISIAVTTQTDFDCATHYVNQNFVAQVSGGIPPYQLQWSSGTVSGANNEIMHTNTNGTVFLTVTDAQGCVATSTVVVATPILGYSTFETSSFGYTTYGLYAVGDPIQFQSNVTGDYTSISWDFGDGTFSTELNPIHIYNIPKDYIVKQTVTYPFGCIYVQTISLIVEKGYVLVVPTAFTPNNDGVNDTFRPVTKALKNVKLDVYDTWGSLIYSETGDVLKGWDAKIKGVNAENGNYYSKVSAETFYGTIVNSNQTFVLIK